MSAKGCEGAFAAWMHRTAMEASINCFGDGYYAGESGARRLARECGYKIPEFRDYGEDHIGDTYRGVCAIAYQMRPPIGEEDWTEAVIGACEAEKGRRRAVAD